MKAPGARSEAIAWLAAVCLLAAVCGRPSDEGRIKGLLKETVRRAENKDIAGLRRAFAPDYSDFEGRDIERTVDLVSDHLAKFRGVVIHLLGARVETIGPDGTASVECEVSLSHGAAEVLRKLIRYAGEYYRFRIELRKEGQGEWLYTYAEWRSIGLADLFPESLAILKELFPDL